MPPLLYESCDISFDFLFSLHKTCKEMVGIPNEQRCKDQMVKRFNLPQDMSRTKLKATDRNLHDTLIGLTICFGSYPSTRKDGTWNKTQASAITTKGFCVSIWI